MTPICAASSSVVSHVRCRSDQLTSVRSRHVRIWDECLQYACISTDTRVAAASFAAPFSLVLSAVASSSPSTTSSTSSTTTSVRALCAWSSSSCSSSSSSPSSSAAASSGSSGLAPDRPGSPLCFVQHHLVVSVSVLFFPFVYSDECGLHRHLLPRHCAPATVLEASSTSPSDDSAWCVPSLARPVLATPVRAIVRGVFWAWQTRECLAYRLLTASTSAPTPFRLPRRVAVFVLGGFPFAPPSSRRLLEHLRLPERLLTLGNLDSSTSTTATLRTASSTTAIHPTARLPRHRHKGLPSA